MVIVARRQMDVTANPVPFPPHDHADLGMCLQANDAIDDMHACLFQFSRPGDVALFVEARLQFQEDSHLFAAFARFEQRIHDGRIAAHAVERLFDGEHVRIARRGVEKIDHRAERIIRVMYEDVPCPDRLENIIRGFSLLEDLWDMRFVCRELQIVPFHTAVDLP